MKSFEVARQFDLMADVLKLKGENIFRVRAYRRAAQNLVLAMVRGRVG